MRESKAVKLQATLRRVRKTNRLLKEQLENKTDMLEQSVEDNAALIHKCTDLESLNSQMFIAIGNCSRILSFARDFAENGGNEQGRIYLLQKTSALLGNLQSLLIWRGPLQPLNRE